MIKKIKKYLLASINDKKSSIKSIHWPVLMIKKVNNKCTLTSINDKKRSIKKYTLAYIIDKKRSIKNIHWPVLVLKKIYIDLY